MEIPGYKILSILGQGGMATVYLANQESFDRKVALKVMSAQLAQDPSFGDRFQREARIVSQMNHPNIVTVYDVGVVDNHHYLAMQYVDGKELRHRSKEMSLEDKIRVVKDVASALNYAGNKGYVHRDVKPENVMMSDEDGRGILMDFGIAKASDGNHSMTKTGMAIGTPYYMSPEQAQGKAVDKRSDLYSLGVMFFQLLAGRVPYDAESGIAIGIKHITEPVPLLPKHLQMFQVILEKIMAKDPAKRYQTGAEVIDDLNKISLADLDRVGGIIEEEVEKAQRTDPSAQTVMTETTPPPILDAGEVTTADAQRLAGRISAGDALTPARQKKSQSPFIGLIVIAIVIAGIFYYVQHSEKQSVEKIEVEKTDESSVVESSVAVEQNSKLITSEQKVQIESIAPPTNEMMAEANINAQQNPEAAQVTAQQAKEEVATKEAAAVIEKENLEKASLEKTRQEKLAAEARLKAQKAAEAKAAEQASADMKREAKEKSEQLKRDEIFRRLELAKELHESGALVLPEKNNAVQAYQSVLEVDPDNATATLALKTIESNYLLGIRTLIEKNQFDQATTQLNSASKLFPNSEAIAALGADLKSKKGRSVTQPTESKQAEVQQSAVVKEAVIQEVAASAAPTISKLLVSDISFDSMTAAQKGLLPLGRSAYVGVSYAGFQGSATLLQAVLYDSARTTKIMQKPVVVTGAGGDIYFTLARPVEGFADGGYVIDLMLGEEQIASLSFKVGR